MKKKLLSLFLAVLMSLSLAVPAFAAGEVDNIWKVTGKTTSTVLTCVRA